MLENPSFICQLGCRSRLAVRRLTQLISHPAHSHVLLALSQHALLYTLHSHQFPPYALAGSRVAAAIKARRAAMPTASPLPAVQASHQPTTASQTLQHHLNKVAWWLDLQSENSSHLTTAGSNVPVPDEQAGVETLFAPKGLQGTASNKDRHFPPAQMLPTASTELFLQLEAASQQATDQASIAGWCPAIPTVLSVTAKQPLMPQAKATLPPQASYIMHAPGPIGLQRPVPTVDQGLIRDNRHEIGMPVVAAGWPGQSMHSMLPAAFADRQAGTSLAGRAEHAFSHAPASSVADSTKQFSTSQQEHVPASTGAKSEHAQNSAAKHVQQAESSCAKRAKRAKQAEAHCAKHAKQDECPCPKAAEAPFVREGSYAVAAQEAKARSMRQQQELQQLAAQREQARTETVASKQAAPEARLLARTTSTLLSKPLRSVGLLQHGNRSN